jgi:hypothetical protein
MTDESTASVEDAANGPDHQTKSAWECTDMQTKVATVGVIVVAAALIEVSLVPGMVIGAAAMLAPKYVPQVGDALRPAFRSFVRNAYKFGRKAREAAAEAQEQVHDIVAEVHAEGSQAPGAEPKA